MLSAPPLPCLNGLGWVGRGHRDLIVHDLAGTARASRDVPRAHGDTNVTDVPMQVSLHTPKPKLPPRPDKPAAKRIRSNIGDLDIDAPAILLIALPLD